MGAFVCRREGNAGTEEKTPETGRGKSAVAPASVRLGGDQ
jgi:hypothetical protein